MILAIAVVEAFSILLKNITPLLVTFLDLQRLLRLDEISDGEKCRLYSGFQNISRNSVPGRDGIFEPWLGLSLPFRLQLCVDRLPVVSPINFK